MINQNNDCIFYIKSPINMINKNNLNINDKIFFYEYLYNNHIYLETYIPLTIIKLNNNSIVLNIGEL